MTPQQSKILSNLEWFKKTYPIAYRRSVLGEGPNTDRHKRQGSRANGTNPRALGTNPRALGTNPRATQ